MQKMHQEIKMKFMQSRGMPCQLDEYVECVSVCADRQIILADMLAYEILKIRFESL